MSVAQTAARVSKQAGNGATLAFNGTWKIFAKTDLTVYKVSALGVYTAALTVDVDYTVTFDTAAETWTVTYTVAPVLNGFAVILGNTMPQTQASAFPREGVTPAATLKNTVDKLTVLVQQLDDKIDRAVLQPVTPVNPEVIDIDPMTDRRALIAQDNGDDTWTIIPSTYDPDTQVAAAAASATAAASSASAASTSASAASTSASAAAASAALAATLSLSYSSGVASSKPGAPATNVLYYSTDTDQLELYITTAARWFLLG